MKTKSLFSRMNGTMLFMLCFLFFVANYADALTSDGIIIGYAKHPEATAYNNGRRIVRTSADRRIVVYQDSSENRPVVMCVYSDDGIHWSKPAIVAHGSFPSVAVADNDYVYLVSSLEGNTGIGILYSKNGALTWENGTEIRPAGALACRYPVVEATRNAVHTVWQQQSISTQNERICYQQFNKDLSATLTPIHVLSADTCHARFPLIQGDLEFEADLLHVVWCDEPMSSASPRLMYCNFFENSSPSFSKPEMVPNSWGKTYPSISARGGKSGDGAYWWSLFVMACVNENRGITIALVIVNASGIQRVLSDSLATTSNPLPSADDVHFTSCAIVWQDSGEIFYGQTLDEHFTTLPPIPVSKENSFAGHPNVCYKTFRRDSIDVVWMEGNSAPYEIIYRRIAKQYSRQPVEHDREQAPLPGEVALWPNYPNPFNNSTLIALQVTKPQRLEVGVFDLNGKRIRTLFAANTLAGVLRLPWDATDDKGNAISSGIYWVKVTAERNVLAQKILLLK
jgi:hypothetical protein